MKLQGRAAVMWCGGAGLQSAAARVLFSSFIVSLISNSVILIHQFTISFSRFFF
jgi:hypothetical protein